MIDYTPLVNHWRDSALNRWAQVLATQVEQGLSQERYGDLASWLKALEDLPAITADSVQLNSSRVGAGCTTPLDAQTTTRLRDALQRLHPWRKGPFELFGATIDTEWRSDWKWDRLLPGIDTLAGRRVLDVGCGSGYHCWRMLGEGAAEVIGIDPSPLFVVQFWALQKYLRQNNVWVLPLAMEQVPTKLQAFDTVFSMGVLYHRRSPLDHLQELRGLPASRRAAGAGNTGDRGRTRGNPGARGPVRAHGQRLVPAQLRHPAGLACQTRTDRAHPR